MSHLTLEDVNLIKAGKVSADERAELMEHILD